MRMIAPGDLAWCCSSAVTLSLTHHITSQHTSRNSLNSNMLDGCRILMCCTVRDCAVHSPQSSVCTLVTPAWPPEPPPPSLSPLAVWQCGSVAVHNIPQQQPQHHPPSPTITHHHRPHTVKEDHHSPSGRQSRQDNPVLSQSNLDIQQDMKCHLAFNIMTLSSVTALKTSITSIIPTWLKSATTIYLTQTLKCWIHLNNFIYERSSTDCVAFQLNSKESIQLFSGVF